MEGVWQRCVEDVCETAAGAEEGGEYVPGAADVGHRMRLEVTATDEEGVTQAGSPFTEVVLGAGEVSNQKPPVLGDAFVFRALEVMAGVWLSDRELARTYQWQRCDPSGGLPGATRHLQRQGGHFDADDESAASVARVRQLRRA